MVFSMTNLENLVYKEDYVDILEMYAYFYYFALCLNSLGQDCTHGWVHNSKTGGKCFLGIKVTWRALGSDKAGLSTDKRNFWTTKRE